MAESYLSNELSPDDHVAACPDCSAVLALLDRPETEPAPPPTLRESALRARVS
jgi:hypothetical protein